MEQLKPSSLYIIITSVYSGDSNDNNTSTETIRLVTTLDALPPAPYDFRMLAAPPRALYLGWQLNPVNDDGELRRFLLELASTYNPKAKTTIEVPFNGKT